MAKTIFINNKWEFACSCASAYVPAMNALLLLVYMQRFSEVLLMHAGVEQNMQMPVNVNTNM